MDETTSLYTTKRQTINPLVDEINKETEPILKRAMKEFGFELPLAFRLYNQIRFYEEYGKLTMGTSVASKEQLATQFGVTVKQIEGAFNNLTNKYKLGGWVDHDKPVFRNVKRTWMSTARLKNTNPNYYSVIPELLQRNSTTITVEQLPSEVRPLSESKKKVRESNKDTDVSLAKAYGHEHINELFDYWQKTVGYEITSKRQSNRNACNNLYKKYGKDGVHKLIMGIAKANQDKYAPRISDFVDLQAKLNQLLAWGNRQSNNRVEVI